MKLRRPWWLFYGLARETERMRFYSDADLAAHAFARLARSISDAGRQMAEALALPMRQVTVAINAYGRAWVEAFARSVHG